MTERERTSTSTATRDDFIKPDAVKPDAVKPDDGVEVFDATGAMPTPGHSGTATNFNPDSVNHSGYTRSEQSTEQPTDLGTTISSNTAEGTNGGRLLTTLVIIIVVALLLYWIF